ncbi:hypothetical protein SAMN02745824_2443 [Parasphingorhabdus marina DSM 22363]|uniref:Lipoprotein n=1 Tax=Parasphingorhabdus marina DSM 22363 TaxID=1123272 RepID=A0A1N6FLD7_9SPHN|nr:hypothetical protein [Parasphingorhabdus marina]SIN96082.1 hypothetical protein SAMN02745824_2443 [Parasphingorhabdus marina DSM 22363]
MRIFKPLLLLPALVACDNRPDNDVLADVEQRAASQPADDGRIECAINGDTSFTRGCQTERLSGEEGVTLIIRHPDGGFRRFRVLTDGRGLEAADGSEPARIEIVEDDKIRVSIGSDRYILPARMKPTDDPEIQAGN